MSHKQWVHRAGDLRLLPLSPTLCQDHVSLKETWNLGDAKPDLPLPRIAQNMHLLEAA